MMIFQRGGEEGGRGEDGDGVSECLCGWRKVLFIDIRTSPSEGSLGVFFDDGPLVKTHRGNQLALK